MSKKCTPLWCEAHFASEQVKKTPHVRSTFGSWDVEKVVVARSTFRSQNVQRTPRSDRSGKLRCRKSVRRCGAKHIARSKCTKHTSIGQLLEVQMSLRVAGARGCAPCQKWEKREGFVVALPKTMAGRGHLKRICKDAFSVAGAVQETCSSELFEGQGADFPREVAFWSDLQVCWDDFAWQVQHFIWPGITFSWQAQYFRQVEWKNRRTHWYEAVSSALNFPFLKEVSQNPFAFDVVNFENWGSLAELFRFWRCQVQKLRRSRRIAAFSSLQADRQTGRQTDR